MKTRILLEAKGKVGMFEEIKLEISGSSDAVANILLMAIEQSEGFYDAMKVAINVYELKN